MLYICLCYISCLCVYARRLLCFICLGMLVCMSVLSSSLFVILGVAFLWALPDTNKRLRLIEIRFCLTVACTQIARICVLTFLFLNFRKLSTRFEIHNTQNKGHFAVQGHSRSTRFEIHNTECDIKISQNSVISRYLISDGLPGL